MECRIHPDNQDMFLFPSTRTFKRKPMINGSSGGQDPSSLFYSGSEMTWDQFYDRVFLFLELDTDFKTIDEKKLRKDFDPRMTKVRLGINDVRLVLKERNLKTFLESYVVDSPKEVERSYFHFLLTTTRG